MSRIRSPCCARAASGHAAAPPTSVMNSRRLIATPQGSEQAIVAGRLAGSGQNGAWRCPLWVKSRHRGYLQGCPLYLQKRTFAEPRSEQAPRALLGISMI